MSAKHLSTALVQVTISVLLICLFALPASAVKKARESWVNGGWQLWIEATDFDRRHTDKIIATGKEAKELAEKAPRPWLGGDLIFGLHMDGYVEYDFANPGDGGAYIYCRAMNFVHGRAYSQSWFIALNGDDPENRGLVIDTNPEWQWRSGRIGALSPTRLKKGVNTIRVIPREAEPGAETLMDILVVSTVPFEPTDEACNDTAPFGESVIVERKVVNLEEQFTVDIFAWLRENPLHRFSFDLTFDPSVLQVVRVEEGTVLSSDGAAATWWGEPEVDNEKGVITHIACRRTGKEGVAKRKGVLAVATFKAAKAGTSDVTLQNLRLMTPNGEEIPAPARAGAVDIYPHGSISGVVRAARSKIPLSEGQIEVSRNGFAFRVSTYSDRQGKYTLDGVPVGRFDVTAFSPMYIETTTEIEVKGRKMTSNVDFELTLVPLASAGGDASIGQPAPDFTLEDLNGNSVNLSALKGAPAILHFWASWSSPCRDQVAHLEALWKKYKAQGLTLIGMNNESDHANAKAFTRDKISYPVALDGWAAFEAYGVSEVPCICYIDREGIVRYRDVGFGSGKEEEIERKIKELLH